MMAFFCKLNHTVAVFSFLFCSNLISLIKISIVYPGLDATNNVRSRKIYNSVNEMFGFVSLRSFCFYVDRITKMKSAYHHSYSCAMCPSDMPLYVRIRVYSNTGFAQRKVYAEFITYDH